MSIRCTPFCRPCDKGYKHHELLIVLLNTRDLEQGFSDNRDHELLEKAINKYKQQGWDINTEILETNVEFRFPLLHWACVLGKIRTVRWLLDNGFSPTVQTKESLETCVHRALITLPETCSTKSGRLSVARFETMLPYLRDCLAIGNHRQDTPLHIAAQYMVQNKCFTLYENLFITMLTEVEKMPWNERRKCLNAQNGSGDTALNVLASGCKSLTVMEKLLGAGADSMLANKLNIGPLDNAERHGLVHIANFLKSLLLKGCGMLESAAEYRKSSLNDELKKRRSERRSTFYSTMASLAGQVDENNLDKSTELMKQVASSPSKSLMKSNESIDSETVNYYTEDEETSSQSSQNSESLHLNTDHSSDTFDPSEAQVKNEDYEMCQCCEVDDDVKTVPTAAHTKKAQDKTGAPDVRLFDVMKEAGVLPNLADVITRTKEEHLNRMKALEKSLCEMNGKEAKRNEKEKSLEKEIDRKKREIEKLKSELYDLRRQKGNLSNKRKLMEEESQDLRKKLVCCETLLRTVPKDTCS